MSRNIMQVFHWNKMSVKPPTKNCKILFIVNGWPNSILKGCFDELTPGYVYEFVDDNPSRDEFQFNDVSYWAYMPLPPQED